jgi:hypothetical protein
MIPMHESEIRLALRITARISFLLFSASFTANALSMLWPTALTNWVRLNRDRFLIAFAVSHTLHLAAIISLIAVLGRPRNSTLAGGGFVFLLIYGQAAAAIARSLGRKQLAFWGASGFETFSVYAIWLVFALGFIPRMISGRPIYSLLGMIAIADLVARIAGSARRSRLLTTN